MVMYITRETKNDELITLQEGYLVLHTDDKYKLPPPHTLKAVRKRFRLTQVDVAKITGVKWDKKGSSTVSKWEADIGKPEHRQIPYAAWRLLLVTLFLVDVEEYTREQ